MIYIYSCFPDSLVVVETVLLKHLRINNQSSSWCVSSESTTPSQAHALNTPHLLSNMLLPACAYLLHERGIKPWKRNCVFNVTTTVFSVIFSTTVPFSFPRLHCVSLPFIILLLFYAHPSIYYGPTLSERTDHPCYRHIGPFLEFRLWILKNAVLFVNGKSESDSLWYWHEIWRMEQTDTEVCTTKTFAAVSRVRQLQRRCGLGLSWAATSHGVVSVPRNVTKAHFYIREQCNAQLFRQNCRRVDA